MSARSASNCLSRSSLYFSKSWRPSRSSLARSFPASLTSFFLLFAPAMMVSATACPAWKLALNATPDFISWPNALAASPRPLTPCSLNTLMAAITPLNGATTNLRMEFPTPTTPWMTFWNRPLEVTNVATLVIRSARMPTMFCRSPEMKSMTGLRASIPFLTAFVPSSSSLRELESFMNRDMRMEIVPTTGDAERASNPLLTPITPPLVASRPFLNVSAYLENPLNADS